MTTQRIFAALLMAVALLLGGLVALSCKAPEPEPLPAHTPYPTQLPLPTHMAFPTGTRVATYTPTPSPTSTTNLTPTPQPTSKSRPTLTPLPTPILAPTSGTIVPTLLGKVGDWQLSTADASHLGYRARTVINTADGAQQYTCINYLDGEAIARVNVKFTYELNHEVVRNKQGELQGSVKSITRVAGDVVPVEWRTWVSRTDRLRLRSNEAVLLVSEIVDQQAKEFTLELMDNPELSATYSTISLIEALDSNHMTCFQ